MMQMMNQSGNSMMMHMPGSAGMCWAMHILLFLLGILSSIVLVLLIVYLWRLVKKPVHADPQV